MSALTYPHIYYVYMTVASVFVSSIGTELFATGPGLKVSGCMADHNYTGN